MSEPPITIRAAHDSGPQTAPVTRWVVHDEEYPVSNSSGEAIAHFFASPQSGGSAHYVFDGDGEEHCVPENTIAWHAPPNNGSLGAEHDGYARFGRADWLSPGSLASLHWSAARAADVCTRYGLPVTRIGSDEILAGRRGICGHVDVTAAYHQSDHTDPGSEFPYDVYLDLINQHLNPPNAWKVKPMYNPPLQLEPIAASANNGAGGVVLLSIGGGIYCFGTPFHGSPEADPKDWGNRQGAEIRFGSFAQHPYTVKDTAGEFYDYGYQPGQAPPRW